MAVARALAGAGAAIVRSEEHTSELQSRLHLVCRLLLEKKKKLPSSTAQVAPLTSGRDLTNYRALTCTTRRNPCVGPSLCETNIAPPVGSIRSCTARRPP